MSDFLSTSPADLARALAEQKRSIEEQETSKKAGRLQLPYVNLHNFPMDLNALALMPEAEAMASQSVPFFKDKHDVRIGTLDPNNQLLKSKVLELTKEYRVSVYLISQSSFDGTLPFYKKVVLPTSKFSETINVDKTKDYKNEIETLKNSDANTPATEIITSLFGGAVYQGSSDIHLEPEEHVLKARYRVDGVLHDVVMIPRVAQNTVISRIKLLAKLKFNVTNEPQDGRITILVSGEPLDVRVSVLPSAYGEAVVMRLLGVGAVSLKVSELNFTGRAQRVINEQLVKPNGMILATGPTGSGKTTTLYAFLRDLNQPGVKIITLEDPVEYKIEGIQQTPIDHKVDFSFAKGLRSVLRQDPDIVMVGEIRDAETAETALQAALTGHVVLSTLHTNDASGAIPRLLTMGVKPFIIAPAINAIIAQRLVRRLCQQCIEPAQVDQVMLEKVQHIISEIPQKAEIEIPQKLEFYHSKGCDACNGLGYKGRMGVHEVIEVNDQMRELILKEPSGIAIKQLAIQDGTVSMLQDGIVKALHKYTDLDEVFRVVG